MLQTTRLNMSLGVIPISFSGSLGDIIKRHFAFSLAKLDFHIDYAVSFFVGKHYNRLNVKRADSKSVKYL